MSNIIDIIEKEAMRTDLPKLSIGDTVKVWVKVKEGNRERLQAFEGIIIAFRHGSVRETFTVRRLSFGVGVERTFPLHSPKIDHIDIVRHGKSEAVLSARQGRQGGETARSHQEVTSQRNFRHALRRADILCG